MIEVKIVPYGGPAMPGHPIARVRADGRELLYSLWGHPYRLRQVDEAPVGRLLDWRVRFAIWRAR